GFETVKVGNQLSVRQRHSQESIAEAIKVPLKIETVSLSKDFMRTMPDSLVVPPRDGQIHVLTPLEETDPKERKHAPTGYKIVRPGTVFHGPLTYSFKEDQIYDAPYSRFRFTWKERAIQPRGTSVEHVSRREVSRLLFDHLKQIKQTHLHMIQGHIEKRRLALENIQLRRAIEQEYSFAGIVGTSEKVQELLALVRSIAATDVSVLIQGETGTGKELIAKAIHYNSPRRSNRFVAVNCGSLTETLLESELFGHEKGAFTGAITQRKGIFEFADGGTLFLDEIGEIPPSTQVKLLRVLQEGEFHRVGGRDVIKVNVRIVAATNQNLEELIAQGRFRQDLYYRLNVVPIGVPPLRERIEDIPLLVSHFIEKRNPQLNQRISGMSPETMALIMAHSWPGNVRELENVIQRMMVVAKGEILDVHDLPPEMRGKESPRREKAKDLKGVARESAGMVEQRAILDALAKSGGNVTQAARALGISRVTLQKKMKVYNLRAPSS
ncbi:MAG TPA: sigma-54 dependent transcriptional regulator, partial [Candidatus Obscuribacterales bacterium]